MIREKNGRNGSHKNFEAVSQRKTEQILSSYMETTQCNRISEIV